MKSKLIYKLASISLVVVLSACSDYLDPTVITDYTDKYVLSNYDLTKDRVTGIYTRLRQGFYPVGGSTNGAMLASASDESEHTLETSPIQDFNIGSWNSYSNPDNVWGNYYRGIRMANQYIASNATETVNLDRQKYDPNSTEAYEIFFAEVTRWDYEVRYLRAYFYFELVKRYGGVPLLTEALPLDYDISTVTRSSLEDCINFIVSECETAAQNLPESYSDGDLGRATKGAALALKSRVLLYAASDLYNTASWAGGYSNEELISLPQGNREQRWRDAANAAKAVIDLNNPGYELANNYSAPFQGDGFQNSEVIFTVRDGSSNNFEKNNISVGYDEGRSGTTPSQNLVDTYEMKDGSEFDWNNPEHAQNPYANRDDRLEQSIVFNDKSFKGRPIEVWDGGQDGFPVPEASRTGYYLQKYVNENLDLVTNKESVHSWIVFRLGEMYLNYAEALNEVDPGNPDITYYLNLLRQRGGLPDLPASLSQNEAREKIRNERRVELAFEEHRIWDVRRWMTAPSALGSPLRGVNVQKQEDGSFTYQPVNIENRTFSDKMYFYPIPQGEVEVAGLIQNPLW